MGSLIIHFFEILLILRALPSNDTSQGLTSLIVLYKSRLPSVPLSPSSDTPLPASELTSSGSYRDRINRCRALLTV